MARTLKNNIFKNKGAVPPSILRLLMVRNGGADITDRLAHWRSKTSDTPYAVPVITVTNTTGKITASKVVARVANVLSHGDKQSPSHSNLAHG